MGNKAADPHIMSGDKSVTMWKDINRIKGRRNRLGVYGLAVRCQELESQLIIALKRLDALEGKGKSDESTPQAS